MSRPPYPPFFMSCIDHSAFALEVGKHGGIAEELLPRHVGAALELVARVDDFAREFVFNSLFDMTLHVVVHTRENGKAFAHLLVGNHSRLAVGLLRTLHLPHAVLQLFYLLLRVLYGLLYLFLSLGLTNQFFLFQFQTLAYLCYSCQNLKFLFPAAKIAKFAGMYRLFGL